MNGVCPDGGVSIRVMVGGGRRGGGGRLAGRG